MQWSKEQDEQIIQLYKTLKVCEISKKTGISASAITNRLYKLGIKKEKKFKWDETTLNKVLELTKTHSIAEISKIMGVSRNTIASKLQRLGIKAVDKRPQVWSDKEIEFLKANYNTMNKEYLAKKLGRSYVSVVARASIIGISPQGKPQNLWSKEEEEYLRKNYNMKSRKLIAKNLGRTEEAIHLKAKKMKLGNKSEKRITVPAIANILGVKKDAVHHWYSKGVIQLTRIPDSNMLYISLPALTKFMKENQDLWDTRNADYSFVFTNKPTWLLAKEESDKLKPSVTKKRVVAVTFAEIRQIKTLYSQGLSVRDIATKINRSETTVQRYISDEHLKDYTTGYYMSHEIEFIENNLEKLTVKEIAHHLNRPVSSVSSKIKLLKENENVKKIKKIPWTEKELDKLQKNLDKSIPELQKIIKSRSYRAIDHKKRELLGLE